MSEGNNQKSSLENSLVDSIGKESLGDIAKDVAEVALDATLDEGLLRAIPAISILSSSYTLYVRLRAGIYRRKIAKFFTPIGQVSREEREEFVRKLRSDKKESKRFAETVFLLLEQHDSMKKPEIMGKIFKACIEQKIDYKEAMLLSALLNRAYLSDLEDLVSGFNGEPISHEAIERLVGLGLLHLRVITGRPVQVEGSKEKPPPSGIHISGGTITKRASYEITHQGKLLVEVGFL